MDHSIRRSRLAARLPDLGVEAILVTRLVNVRYLTGFSGSNAFLLLSAGGARFFTDFRYEEQSRHEVPDLDRVVYTTTLFDHLGPGFAELGVSRVGFEAAGVTYQLFQDLSEKSPGIEFAPLGPEVEKLRWVKDADELAAIRRAQAVTDEGFERVVGKLVEGMTERELAIELEFAMRQAGGDGLAFETIAAFGESAAEPHHNPTDRRLEKGDVVKLDFGALVDGYHSDMTRTVAFGEPDPKIREIYQIVRNAQQAGIDAVRAGVVGADADAVSRKVIQDAGYGEQYGHSLGHGVGLEIHEGPTLRKASEDVLPAGTVVTVEPGIYLPGIGGVRIEDMVQVTQDGCIPMPSTTKDLLIL
ncbi:MAG: aminopeptidase P family protein [Actinobacteria bacterium]|nr:aminopeptidase P family protein [Actinomycetota bacterium]